MKQKKQFTMPHVFVILFVLLVVATIATYIVPAGTYDFMEVNGKNVINPDSFHYIDQTPVGPWQMIMDIPQACVNAAMLIICSLIISGSVSILNATQALDATIGTVAHAARSKLAIAVPVVMAPFTILGCMGITEPNNVAFIPLGLMVAAAFGADALAGSAIILFATSAGFSLAPFGAVTTANAQTIAGLPIYSGWELRCVGALVMFVINAFFVVRYIKKVQADPSASLCAHDPNVVKFSGEFVPVELTTRRKIVALVFGLQFAAVVWSVIKGICTVQLIACVFLVGGVISGIIAGYNANKICELFCDGLAQIAFGVFMIGFAGSIALVMTQGNIIHTCIHAMAGALGALPPALTAIGMNIMNIFVNFFIISGSGQAFVVMPIQSPLASIVGVTQQTAILAYQLGDGFTNFIYPQSGVLMAGLAVSRVNWADWAKFAWKPVLAQTIAGWGLLIVATLIGYGAALG